MGRARLQATRWFRSDPVEPVLVEEILDEARRCGSARNRQPWHLFVAMSPPVRRALSGHAPYGAFLADAPVVVVIGLDHERGGADTELDGGRLTQSLLRASEDRGLGSCPATFFPTSADRAVAEIVGAPPGIATRTAVAVGWPATPPSGRAGRSAIPTGRRRFGDVVTWVDATPGYRR